MNSLLFPARDCTAPTAPAVLASASGAWGGRNVSRDAGREWESWEAGKEERSPGVRSTSATERRPPFPSGSSVPAAGSR